MNKLIACLILMTFALGIIAEDKKEQASLPKLIDLGASKCIPCKMMAPILEELKKEYAGVFEVEFIDVWQKENATKAQEYKVEAIPTQVFLGVDGKELFRHVGFFSKENILAKWNELGVKTPKDSGASQSFERLKPARADERPKDQICYMCDGSINPKTLVAVKSDKGDVRLCSPHCYFIMYSCLTEDKAGFEEKVRVTDFSTEKQIPLKDAFYLVGADKSGRPTIQAYADEKTAEDAKKASGGNVLKLEALKAAELSHLCGFCDRACYPQDAAKVVAGGVQTWGCCSHCALGVAARTGKDIEVQERDRLTGEPVVVKTLDGQVASLEPSTAVAWFGQRQKPDGTWVSAGCFHQGFFRTPENLKKWVEANPFETGRMISIDQALSDKMKLSPEQIKKACKIGECAPKP